MSEATEPEYVVEGALAERKLWQIADDNVTLIVECLACPWQNIWDPEDIRTRFSRSLGKTINDVAERAKCSRCKSRRVRFWRAAPGFVKPDST